MSRARTVGVFPRGRGACQAELHQNGDPEGGARAAGEPEHVGAQLGPDSECVSLSSGPIQNSLVFGSSHLSLSTLQLYQCMSDLECSEGSYCHAPTKGPAHSRCQTCRRRKRRCHRDGMCCPGNRCSNSKNPRKLLFSLQMFVL